jgi:penicillin-binding protein 1A
MKTMEKQSERAPKAAENRRKGGCLGGLAAFLLFLFLFSAAVLSVGGAVYVWSVSRNLPTSEEMVNHRPNLATIVYDRNGKVITNLYYENRQWAKLGTISEKMVKAVLAAEDADFYEHRGIKPTAILRAFIKDVTHQETRQGGSTITQQLARNLFLTRERTLTRKVKEAVLAIRMEKTFPKEQILEMYLNTIYFGHGTYGIEAASQTYFGKAPSQLNLAEASVLAGLIAAPEYYTPVRHLDRAKVRQGYVLGQMVSRGWISREEAQKALDARLSLKTVKKTSVTFTDAPYFISNILFGQLLPKYGSDAIYRGGMRIYTTLDFDLQRDAEEAIKKLPSEGAIVALDPETGEILAMVGGRDFEKSKFNRVTQAFRQPGSAFKPIVYAAALEAGYRPVDHLLDSPLEFPNGWKPSNYDMKHHGEVSLVEALTYSYNVPTVKLAHLTGLDNVTRMARNLGITTPHLPNDLSLALGSTSVTPLEMAVAYSCFENGGKKVLPYSIREVRDNGDSVLEKNGPTVTEGISPRVAVMIRSMLLEAVRAGTGRGAAIPGHETFGKTGTTNEWSDAWFCGGVPGLVTIVYAGHDDHKPLGDRMTGGRVASPVWKAFVSKAASRLKLEKNFTVPKDADVEIVRVCRHTGYLAGGSCPAAEILIQAGEGPSATCPLHGGSLSAAKSDSLAPRLLLSPMDEGLPAMQGFRVEEEPAADAARTPAVPPVPAPVLKVPSSQPPKAPSPAEKPYRKDPSKPNDVEKRYQELLKQYGLTN